MTVNVYSTPSCVQCKATYRALDAAGMDYTVTDVTQDPEALEMVRALGYNAAPVIVVGDGDVHWSGYRPDLIKSLVSVS